MGNNLFDNVYNPDVLSCIANLSNDEVFTPPEVVNKMLDTLPQELFENPDTTFLDPACKTGVFLREIAKRLIKGLEHQIPDLQKRLDHIFHKQLYGIAITELTSLLSRRGVYCSKYPNGEYSVSKFDNGQGNIRFKKMQHTYINGTCKYCGASKAQYDRDGTLENYAYEFIHNERLGEIFNMKFDVIIGNPPYQLKTAGDDNGAQARPIYNLFVNKAIQLNPTYVVMITPSRWMTGGWNLDEFRMELVQDKKIEEMHDFPNANDCFPGVEIKGGVCFYKWNKNYVGNCKYITHQGEKIVSEKMRPLYIDGMDTVVRYNDAISIIEKIRLLNEKSFSDIVSRMKPFGLPTKYKGNEKKDKVNNIKIYANQKTYYENVKNIKKGIEDIGKYKIIIPKAVGSGDPKVDRIKPIISEPESCCTETYIMVGPFNSKKICDNVLSYINTKFFHFMLTLHKDTQDCLKKTYMYIPMQDFTESYNDEKLYKKYNLSKREIDFIENTVREDIGGEINEE